MKKKLKILLIILVTFICLIAIFHKPILLGMAQIITAQNYTGEKTDYIVLLMGQQSTDRADHARQLLSEGRADKILLPKDLDTRLNQYQLVLSSFELHKKLLLMDGANPENLIYLDQCATTSTTDEAYCVRNFMDITHPHETPSILLVTNWYHSGRAEWLFKKVIGEKAKIYSSPALFEGTSANNWWTKEYSFLAVFSEYIKWIYWRIKFLVSF